MKTRERLVVDTNALISRLLLPQSIPGRAVRKAVDEGRVLVSEVTLAELAEVLSRAKFDPYVTIEERQTFMRLLGRTAELVPITRRVQVCRDPKDDMILDLALNGEAHLVITGDRDLLALDPFEGIPIITQSAYLERR